MYVSHINSFLDGGAATAARRLHEGLLQSGVDSRFYYSRSQGAHEALGPTYRPARWQSRGLARQIASLAEFRAHRFAFKRATRDRPEGLEVFTSPRGTANSPWPPTNDPSECSEPSLIHLHWIGKFIDYRSFFASLDPQQPLVWTLHDMNPFTGGCHFSGGCENFQSGCGHCPQLAKSSEKDFSRRSFLEKQFAVNAQKNLHVVAPSRWLMQSAQSSPMYRKAQSFHQIPYGVSTSDFYPMDRHEARARLGLDPESIVVSFGAMDVKNLRKGARHLIRALQAIADLPEVETLVFGSGQLPEQEVTLPRILEVGPLVSLLQQRTVYSASDIFVLPSLEDNLPLTGLEAMACETAVVAFAAGGIPDYVSAHETGLLAKVGDGDELGRQLRWLVERPEQLRQMAENARQHIRRRFSTEREVAAYEELYHQIVDAAGRARRAA